MRKSRRHPGTPVKYMSWIGIASLDLSVVGPMVVSTRLWDIMASKAILPSKSRCFLIYWSLREHEWAWLLIHLCTVETCQRTLHVWQITLVFPTFIDENKGSSTYTIPHQVQARQRRRTDPIHGHIPIRHPRNVPLLRALPRQPNPPRRNNT